MNAVGDRGIFKGYVYAEQAPSPLVASLDNIKRSDGITYRHIKDNWYLYARKTD